MPDWTPRYVPFPPPVRAAILARDPTCVSCGLRPSAIADHIVPVAEGGPSTLDNGQGLCRPCHTVKTRAERQRGYQRWNAEQRPRQRRAPERHPGVIE